MNNNSKPLFLLQSDYKPTGDQPSAIKGLVAGQDLRRLLLGVTGSGKTFTLANLIAQQNKQVLILSPNKTLAAQLFEEFSSFFPQNKVCYFVSYFDYYQPESYIPSSDTYIPKDSRINAEIERLRVEATAALISRPDTIIIASVSAIYSLGNPSDYRNLALKIYKDQKINRRELIEKLIDIQYLRNDESLESGHFQVIGNQITLSLAYVSHNLRILLSEDKVQKLEFIDRKNFDKISEIEVFLIFPAKHFVIPKNRIDIAVQKIKMDLDARLLEIEDPVIKARLQNRIAYDIKMLQTTGYCEGIENYSSYLDERETERPFCLLDFYSDNFLFIIDESHIALPQLQAMFRGDQSRKKNLIDFGFRLPSATKNRPLQFEEVEKFFNNCVFVSATPSDYEKHNSQITVEQVVRPTGIVDPIIEIRPREGQIDLLLNKIKEHSLKDGRTLITVLTKKFAEELSLFLENKGVRVCYMHSEIKTPVRTELLNKLRSGEFEALVGINLLREGLDLPEVSFLAIMDADIEGFLRNTRSLVQTIGRAARNAESEVYMFADKITKSMDEAISETNRRRAIQLKYNQDHNITPFSTKRKVLKSITAEATLAASKKKEKARRGTSEHKEESVVKLKQQMMKAAKEGNFSKAIELRELIKSLVNK